MKGIVERTRTAVVEVASKSGSQIDDMSNPATLRSDEDMTMDDEDDLDDETLVDSGRENWEMKIATVYEKTIMLLGECLDLLTAGELR